MAPHSPFRKLFGPHLALVIMSPILVLGLPTTLIVDETAFHSEHSRVEGGGGAATRPPWEGLNPHFPTLPPIVTGSEYTARSQNPFEISICDLDVCACKNRTKDGMELVDISCNCGETKSVLKIREGMLPRLADTLEIADCDRVRLDGMAPPGKTSDEGGLQVPGRRASNRNKWKNNFQYTRRKREAKVSDGEESEADEGGVEWEEAVWEAELGSPDEEEQEAEDPPDEEEEDSTPEGEESEKGGRYARAAPALSKEPRPLSSLTVRRTRELRMEPHAVGPVRSVLLEDVRIIRIFPPYAFQPPPPGPAIHPSGYHQAESLPHGAQWEMESVTFKNVSDIEKFSESSFSNVLINSHFLWLRTNVVIMDLNAIRVIFREVDEDDSVDPCETSYRAGNGQAKAELNATTGQLPVVEVAGGNTSSGNASVVLKTMCEASQGGFTVAESVISMWGMNAFSIIGARTVIFDGCHASRLSPSSIYVGGANSFTFTRNSVLESASMFAFSVTATFVEFRRNRFGRLEEGAMSGVKPMLSKASFGLPRFTFEDNLLMDVDPLSLHPNWDIPVFHNKVGDHVSHGYSFQKNAFADCSCPHIGWIVQLTGEHELSSNFYAHILKDESGNYCVREPVEPMGLVLPCRLPLKGINFLFEEDGITCKRHVDVVELCEIYQSAASSLIYSYYFQGLFALSTWTVCSFLMSSCCIIT